MRKSDILKSEENNFLLFVFQAFWYIFWSGINIIKEKLLWKEQLFCVQDTNLNKEYLSTSIHNSTSLS